MSKKKPPSLVSAYNAGVKAGTGAQPGHVIEIPEEFNTNALRMSFLSGARDGVNNPRQGDANAR